MSAFLNIEMSATTERKVTETETRFGNKINQDISGQFEEPLQIPAAKIVGLSAIDLGRLKLEFESLEAQTIAEIISQIKGWIAKIEQSEELPAKQISEKLAIAGKVVVGNKFVETDEGDGGKITAKDSRGIVVELDDPDSDLYRVLKIAQFLRNRIEQIEISKSALLKTLNSNLERLEDEQIRISEVISEISRQEFEIQESVAKLGGVFEEIAHNDSFIDFLREDELGILIEEYFDKESSPSSKEKIGDCIPEDYRENLRIEKDFKENEFGNEVRTEVVQKLSAQSFSELVSETQKFEEMIEIVLSSHFSAEKFFQRFGLSALVVFEMAQNLSEQIGHIFERETSVGRSV